MEEGTVASWIKKEGDTVSEGDILAEIETDKATMEFESFYSGTLLHIGIPEGGSAPVDAVLAIIGPAGTDVAAVLASGSSAEEPAPEAVQAASSPEVSVPVAVVAPASSDGRVFVSPLARKMAAEKGIDLSLVSGSGDQGRIVKRDIENYVPASVTASAGAPAATAPALALL